MKKLLLPLIMLCTIQAFGVTNWYVRPDGSNNVNCDGKTNAAYPGSGTAQHCAYNHPYQLLNFAGNYTAFAGGDTLQFVNTSGTSDTYYTGEQNGGLGTDWHSAIGGICPAPNPTGGAGSGCVLPPFPSGTSGAHTKIIGQNAGSCHDTNHTHLVNPTILSGLAYAFSVFQLTNTNYVDISCIMITQPDTCTKAGTGTGQCANTANSVQYGGIVLAYSGTQGAANLTLTDVAVVGTAASGILGGHLNRTSSDVVSLSDVYVIGNGQAGWNADDGNGGSTNQESIGTINLSHVMIDWNGSVAVKPYDMTKPDTQNAFNYTYDGNSGGYGDGFTLIAAGDVILNVDHSFFRWNSQDGFDGLHLSDDLSHNPAIHVSTSWSEGNEGAAFKIGAGAASTAINNIAISNCRVMSTASNFPLNPTNWNAHVAEACRANGDEWSFQSKNGSLITLQNNTTLGYGHVMLDSECAFGASTCSSTGGAKIIDQNNLRIGFTDPGTSVGTAGWFFGDSNNFANSGSTSNHNLWNNMLTGCPDTDVPQETSATCTGALLVGQSNINAVNPHLTSSSNAIGNGIAISGITTDYDGNARPSNPSIGAFEFASGTPTVATPSCTPPAGTYATTQSVTCSSSTSGSTTTCTIDGSTPTHASGVCTSISISSTATLKALSFATGDTDSSIPSFTYTITPIQAHAKFTGTVRMMGKTQE